MKKPTRLTSLMYKHVLFFSLVALIFSGQASGISVTYLATGYIWNTFQSMPDNTLTLAFNGDNAYFVPYIQSTAPIISIDQVNGPFYSSISATYNIDTSASSTPFSSSNFVTGIAFSGTTLFSSESTSSGDSGYIRDLSTGGTIISNLPSFRPSNITVDGANNSIYVTARQDSNKSFGGVYEINSSGVPQLIISGIVGRGLAITQSGDIFVSTRSSDYTDPSTGFTYLASSIYLYLNGQYNQNPTLIATFDSGGITALTFDSNGNLYGLGNFVGSQTPVVKISSVPLPAAFWLFSSAFASLFLLSRRNPT